MRHVVYKSGLGGNFGFPFLFGGAFIEALLRDFVKKPVWEFPFLFGGAFIEATKGNANHGTHSQFPFLFGGAFIEAPGDPHLTYQLH